MRAEEKGHTMTAHTLREQISDELVIEQVLPDIHRIRTHARVIGYVLETGSVYVSLLGSVYNVSVEVGQSHSLDAAIRLLV